MFIAFKLGSVRHAAQIELNTGNFFKLGVGDLAQTGGHSRLKIWSVPVAFISFVFTQNIAILNPRHTGWLWNTGDISSSFTQWIYFRNSPLIQWPITLNSNFGWPWARTIIYTDTPPIFAVPLKYLLAPIDGLIQFTGIQILLSTYLIVLFSALTVFLKTQDFAYSLMSGLAVSTTPVLLFRDVFNHYSLNIMWVIPAAVLLVLKTPSRRTRFGWALLFFISLLWMPYFFIHLGMLWIPYLIAEYYRTRRVKVVILGVLPTIASSALAMIVNGFWYNSSASFDHGLGFYNANLLALINPLATTNSVWSQILPSFRNATDGQYEGFAFLGLGLTSILLICAVQLFRRKDLRKTVLQSSGPLCLLASALLALFLSFGFVIHFSTIEILRIPIPGLLRNPLSTFRSSGRFMILVSLVIALSGLIVFRRFASKQVVYAALTLAIASTLIDSQPQIAINKQQQDGIGSALPALSKPIGEFLDTQQISFVTFIPPESSAYRWKEAVLAAAAIRNFPVNDLFSARPNSVKLTNERELVTKRFALESPRDSEVWVIYPDFAVSQSSRLKELILQSCSTIIGEVTLLARGPCK